MLFRRNTYKTVNNAVQMSYAFHNIARFERFTDLNLSKYVFYVIQTWEMHALQFYWMVLIFLLAYFFVIGWRLSFSEQPFCGNYSTISDLVAYSSSWLPKLWQGLCRTRKKQARTPD